MYLRGVRRWFAILVALGAVLACDGRGSRATTDLAVIPNKRLVVSGTARDFVQLFLRTDVCPILRADATVTVNGKMVPLFPGNPAGPAGPCTSPFATAELEAETGTTLDLVLSDPTQTLSVRLVGYHPHRFEPGDLASATLRRGEVVTVDVPPKPEAPDHITAAFIPRVSPSVGVTWTVDVTLANGQASFTIPADSFVGQGMINVCGAYSTPPTLEACMNAECALEGYVDKDCRNYSHLTIQ